MPLSKNEIRRRATAFAHEWRDASNEDADAKSFWDDFLKVFGIPRRRVAVFEQLVKKLDERGEPIRGLREVDEEQAGVIWASSMSSRRVCLRG